MTAPNNDEFDFCPRCGSPFDTRREAVVICPDCLMEGSTRCCSRSGAGEPCDGCARAQGGLETAAASPG